jgi:hypothetical protein
MALVVPNVGEVKLLRYMLNNQAALDEVLHLYANDPTLSQTSVIGDFTEVTSAGYTAVTLTGGSWTFSTTTASYPEQTFTFTTNATAYGYYVTTTSNDLLWAERFTAAPFSIPNSGGQIQITLNITLSDCT